MAEKLLKTREKKVVAKKTTTGRACAPRAPDSFPGRAASMRPPRKRLRARDGGVCMSFWSPVKGMTPQLEKIESIVMSIAMFAKAQNVTAAQAYKLLTRNRVIEHLDEHYEIESCLPIEHVVSDMEGMCGICRESAR